MILSRNGKGITLHATWKDAYERSRKETPDMLRLYLNEGKRKFPGESVIVQVHIL
jgi:hypothetical protein